MNVNEHPGAYLSRLQETIAAIPTKHLSSLIEKIAALIGTEKTIYIAGNGGNAATASHMACHLSKTMLGKHPREKRQSQRLRVFSLNENIPLLTAWGNDDGYDHIFSQQLENIGRAGDLLIVLTGSGNSQNILELLTVAKKLKMDTYAFLGFDGGKTKPLVRDCIIIPSDDHGIIEDMHMIFVHLIVDWFKQRQNT